MPVAHVINHTHWDREWFLTHEYTTAWIPALVDSLGNLARENADYEFLIDGQSLVIEDLLRTAPRYRDRVHELVRKGTLGIGPVYSQPDWRMVSGELHLRNLQFGIGDSERLGGCPRVAWLVDTFGHISQAPQILAQFGIESAFVWRGVPEMAPVFNWEGADGTVLATVDLFGGYRNLYGVTKTPDIAVQRLTAEVDKLAPFYGELPIPLFDGYDLDTEPEDPVRYYSELDVPPTIDLVASSPKKYVDAIRSHLPKAPTIRGELLSGKFGSTFPGSLSARTYLKVLHHDAEIAVHRRMEPLGVLAAAFGRAYDRESYERASRELLQNGVHDCLCGVSIDQVHERMERSYRRLLAAADHHQTELATAILSGFRSGTYAVSTAAMPLNGVVRTASGAAKFSTQGVGVSAVEFAPVRVVDQAVEDFTFANDHYSIRLSDEGFACDDDDQQLFRLIVRSDAGDTYSSEPGDARGRLEMTGSARLVDTTDFDRTVAFHMTFTDDDIEVNAAVLARFDSGPLIDLTIDLDSTGTGFRVDAEFATAVEAPTVHASMPFDIVERPHEDQNLFGKQVNPDIAAVLMGQRETGHVTEFPFHDFVALAAHGRTAAVLAKGLRSYHSDKHGTITVTLRRSVEWLALTGLDLRSGDAGPMMYVPGARSERTVRHRLGFARLAGAMADCGLLALNEQFQNPPLIASVAGPDQGPASWPIFTTPLPLTGLFLDDEGRPTARVFNPNRTEVVLPRALDRRSVRGADMGSSSHMRGGEIATIGITMPPVPGPAGVGAVTVHTPITDRAGRSRSRPTGDELEAMAARIADLESALETILVELDEAHGDAQYLLTHRRYVVERELLELRLSLELNQRLLHSTEEVSIPDHIDPTIATIGAQLNDLRVKRRIYDYVAQVLGG